MELIQVTKYRPSMDKEFIIKARNHIRKDPNRVAYITDSNGKECERDDMNNCHVKYAVFADKPIGYLENLEYHYRMTK